MGDAQIIAASCAAVVGGGFALREVFKRVVIGKACKAETKKINEFKNKNLDLKAMPPDRMDVTTLLHETILDAHKTRAEKMADAKKIKLPNPNIPMDLPELWETFKSNRNILWGSLTTTYKYKTEGLFFDAVKHKIKVAHAPHVALKAALDANNLAAATTAMAQIPVIKEPHLEWIDQKITSFLNNIGKEDNNGQVVYLTDVSADIGHQFVRLNETLHSFVHDHIPAAEPLLNTLGQVADEVMDLYHALPGIVSSIKNIKKELEMVFNDETSIEDALTNGLPREIAKIIAIKLGIAIDAHAGNAGAFTTLLTAMTRWVFDERLINQNEELKNEFKKIIEAIQKCHDEVLKEINKKAREFEKSFAELIETCPNMNDEPPLKAFINELKIAFALNLSHTETALSDAVRQEIEKLPQDTWTEKLLFINKRKAVEKLYLQAQRELYDVHTHLVHHFTLAAENSPEDALNYMIQNVVFDRPETMSALQNIEAVIYATTQTYLNSLSKWEESLIEARQTGEKNMAEVIDEQIEIYTDFVDARKDRLGELNQKIKANNRRLGMKPAPPEGSGEDYQQSSFG
jgi:hypothetical protein